MKKVRTPNIKFDNAIRGMMSRYKQGLSKISAKDRSGKEIELAPKNVNKTAL